MVGGRGVPAVDHRKLTGWTRDASDDERLVCRALGADDPLFVIRFFTPVDTDRVAGSQAFPRYVANRGVGKVRADVLDSPVNRD